MPSDADLRPSDLDPAARRAAFAGLRAALGVRHREASAAAFAPAAAGLIATGLGELDAALGGGFPRGIIATLEGPPGSGRAALLGRLLATATAGGLGAAIETAAAGRLYPPALAAAGVRLDRLLLVAAETPAEIARAADILLRSGAFGVVAIPHAAQSAAGWTRLASLAHRTNALLVVTADARASNELGFFASLRIALQPARVRWAGTPQLFGTLAGIDAQALVLKHKRAAPGKIAHFSCTTFELHGAPLAATRERELIARALRQAQGDMTLRQARGDC
jgi:recombination protein RecA